IRDFHVTGVQTCALPIWYQRVANWERLRRGRRVFRLLRHGLLFDAHQRLTVGAIEQVEPAGLAGLGECFAGLTVDRRVVQDDRRSEEHTSELQSREKLVC